MSSTPSSMHSRSRYVVELMSMARVSFLSPPTHGRWAQHRQSPGLLLVVLLRLLLTMLGKRHLEDHR